MQYLTIKKTAQQENIAEYALRRMVKTGNCPEFYSGTRFYVCVEKLREKLGGMPANA